MGFAEPVIGSATSGRIRWLSPSYALRLLRTREAIRALYQSHRPAGHRGAGGFQRIVGNFISQDVFVGLFVHDRHLPRIALSL
jgi:hypothetical protein